MSLQLSPTPRAALLVLGPLLGAAPGLGAQSPPLVQKLFAPNPQPWDNFGGALAADGETLAVGAANSGPAGAVFLFEREGRRWRPGPVLRPPTVEFEAFGSAVALQGSTLVVGASYADNLTGAAYVYERVAPGWELRHRLVPEGLGAEALFGENAAIDGDIIVVTAHLDNRFPGQGDGQHGSAHVFGREEAGGDWSYRSGLAYPTESAGVDRRFGLALAVNDPYVAVGTSAWGCVVFARGGSLGDWTVDDQLSDFDFLTAGFGESMAFAGDRLLVGANGLTARFDEEIKPWVYSYRRSGAGGWDQEDRFRSPGAHKDDFFAAALVADEAGGRVAVSAILDDDRGADSGAVFLFDDSVPARLGQVIYAPDAAPDAGLGSALALRGGLLFVGGANDADHGFGAGAVYVFDLEQPAPAVPQVAIQPTGGLFERGASHSLKTFGYGAGPLRYQWFKDGVALPGQTGVDLRLTGLDEGAAGSYTAVISNASGQVETAPAEVAVFRTTPELIDRFRASRAPALGITFDNRSWVSGDTALFSTSGRSGGGVAARYEVYARDPETRRWRRGETLSPPAASDEAALGDGLLVIGKQGHDDGSFYVYERGLGGEWGAPATLVPRSPPGEPWGRSFTVDGETILAGYPRTTRFGRRYVGEIAVFRRTVDGAGAWEQLDGLIRPSQPAARVRFGEAIAIDGDSLMVTAVRPISSSETAPLLYFFARDPAEPGGWREVSRIEVEPELPELEWDALPGQMHIDLWGDTAVLSAPVNENGSVLETTAVYLFRRSPEGTWSPLGLMAYGIPANYFDASIDGVVSIRGDRIAVGSTYWDGAAETSGAVLLFERNAGGEEDYWGWIGVVEPADAVSRLGFGAFVRLFGEGEMFVSTAIDDSRAGVYHYRDVPGVPVTFAWDFPQPGYNGRVMELRASAGGGGEGGLAFQWLKDGVPIPGETEAVLRQVLGPGSEGTYTARVSGASGSAVETHRYAVTVSDAAPFMTVQPEGTELFSGQNLALSAGVDGSGPLVLQWFKDGEPIGGATGGELRIAAAGLDDSGAYHLEASNPLGQVSSEVVTVTVREVQPSFREPPLDLHARPGERVDFWVSAEGSLPLSYQWYFQGEPLEGETGVSLRRRGATLDDRGSYHVVVTNPAGSTASTPVELTMDVLAPGPAALFGGASEDLSAPFRMVAHGRLLAAGNPRFPGPDGGFSGIVYPFAYEPLEGRWVPANPIVGPAPTTFGGSFRDNEFAAALALSDGVMAVGLPRADLSNATLGRDAGKVFVYRREGATWWFDAEVTAPGGASSEFGESVGLSGERLAVATRARGQFDSTLSFFERTAPRSWRWVTDRVPDIRGRRHEIRAVTYGDGFVAAGRRGGFSIYEKGDIWSLALREDLGEEVVVSLATSGSTLAVGLQFTGYLYLYERDPAAGWSRVATVASDGLQGDTAFGSALAIDGSRLAVFGGFGASAGIQVFERDSAGAHSWARVVKVTTSDVPGATGFEPTVALSEDRVVGSAVGAPEQFFSVALPRNAAPAFAGSTVRLEAAVGTPLSHKIEAADADAGDALRFSARGLPGWLRMTDLGDGSALLEGTPAAGDIGVATLTLRVTDSPHGFFAERKLALAVTRDEPPTATGPGVVVVPPGVDQVELDLESVFEDADTPFEDLRFTVRRVVGVGVGSARISGRRLILRVGEGGEGTAVVTVRATDPGGLFADAPLAVSRAAPPSITTLPVGRALAAGEAFTLWVGAEGGGRLNYRWFRDGTELAAARAPALEIPSAGVDDAGDYTVEVSDAHGLVTSHTVAVTVAEGPIAPALTGSAPAAATEDVAYRAEVASEGGAASFEMTEGPDWLRLTDLGNGTAVLRGVPGAGDGGLHAVDVGGAFPGGARERFRFTVEVTEVNDAPFFRPLPPVAVEEDAAPVAIDLRDFIADEEDAAGQLQLSGQGGGGGPVTAVSVDGATVTLAFGADAHGGDTVQLRLTDSGGAVAEASLDVWVRSRNDPPEANPIPPLRVDGTVDVAVVDLTEFFSDPRDAGSLQFRVAGIRGDPLVRAAHAGSTGRLQVHFEPGVGGAAEMDLRATDPGGLIARGVLQIERGPAAPTHPPPPGTPGPVRTRVAPITDDAFGGRGGFACAWSSPDRQGFRVECSPSLETGTWSPLAEGSRPPSPADTETVLWDFSTRSERRFYRLVLTD